MTMISSFIEKLSLYKEKIAIIDSEREISYSDLVKNISNFNLKLEKLNVISGEVVFIERKNNKIIVKYKKDELIKEYMSFFEGVLIKEAFEFVKGYSFEEVFPIFPRWKEPIIHAHNPITPLFVIPTLACPPRRKGWI